MHSNQPFGRYDQGFFNVACALVDEVVARSHLHFLCELDAAGMDQVRREAKTNGRPPPTYTSFVIKAAATALRMHPHLNCMIQETPFSTRLVRMEHMTATVAVERMVDNLDMVFAPMMDRPDERSLEELTLQMRHFAHAAPDSVPEFRRFCGLVKWAKWFPTVIGRLLRASSLHPKIWKAFRGGSFAVTSPGKYGGCDQVLPPWPWPLTFSFGAVKVRPFIKDGHIQARKTMRLTITSDRRLANGAPLARFAEDIRQLLEAPQALTEQTVPAKTETHTPDPVEAILAVTA